MRTPTRSTSPGPADTPNGTHISVSGHLPFIWAESWAPLTWQGLGGESLESSLGTGELKGGRERALN